VDRWVAGFFAHSENQLFDARINPVDSWKGEPYGKQGTKGEEGKEEEKEG
jgi:hypothetical protein